MRIKNNISMTTGITFTVLWAFMIACLVFDFGILWMGGLGLGMSVFSSFVALDGELKFAFILCFVMFFVMLLCLNAEIKNKKQDTARAGLDKDFIKYVDFSNSGIKLTYLNSKPPKNISYGRIKKLKMTVDTSRVPCRSGYMDVIYALILNIYTDTDEYYIRYAPVNINKLFRIVYYSQYVQDFVCGFSGIGEETKEKLQKLIEEYVANNYRASLGLQMQTSTASIASVLWIVFTIALLVIVGIMMFM